MVASTVGGPFVGPTGASATPAIVAAANAFLATLSAAQRKSVLFARGDTTQKQKGSNLPTGLYQRSVLAVGSATTAQVGAFLAIMKATPSTQGYNQVVAEWNADDALAASGGGGGLNFGKKYYYLAIIGAPSTTQSWQRQFGGHHITVKATVHGVRHRHRRGPRRHRRDRQRAGRRRPCRHLPPAART